MEVVIAITELIGVTIDDLFRSEIKEFKSSFKQKPTVSSKFEHLTDQEVFFCMIFYMI